MCGCSFKFCTNLQHQALQQRTGFPDHTPNIVYDTHKPSLPAVCPQVNVEEVKREHKEAADRVVEAVHTALAEGLHKQQHGSSSLAKKRSSNGDGSSGDGSAETAAAVESSPAAGSKRKQDAAAAAAVGKGSSGSPAKKRKPTMLDLVEGSDSGSDSEDGSDAE